MAIKLGGDANQRNISSIVKSNIALCAIVCVCVSCEKWKVEEGQRNSLYSPRFLWSNRVAGSQNSQNGPTKYIYLDSNWFPLAQTNRQEVGATMLSELARNFHFSNSASISTDYLLNIYTNITNTQIHPTSGPLEGGTLITIEGSNLGSNEREIQDKISVGGENCQLVMYSVSTR